MKLTLNLSVYNNVICALQVAMFIVGRFITGIAGGGFSIVVPMYSNEFTEVEIRGTIGCMFQLFLNAGILYTYIIGYAVSIV